ncbi:threonine/serine exporter family protein [Ferrimonas aestuarii]|uniref:Threonine/serine exporter family protein n=1 Tax=Ferrimonas aestuarii TaxID=2569539 RepID=A0A4U1BI02_9GAMM|nr:threonine/serine exporter family protein [Ferrimonas aestuarii]TKB50927.1 threonine/serine exporter family protein [Ferrimonas aestuarii]
MELSEQHGITRIAVTGAQLMLAWGADSEMVEDVGQRFGQALGADSVELSISSNSLVLSTRHGDRCVTTTRRIRDHGINMSMVCEVLRLCVMLEKGLIDQQGLKARLDKLKPWRWDNWKVVAMIGPSCGSFAYLLGADLFSVLIAAIAASTGMILRQQLAQRHFNVLLNWTATAFVTTLVARFCAMAWPTPHADIAMAAAVLMLVPGFPLLNAITDMVKGHYNVGLARWGQATLMTVAAAIGITMAMQLTGLGWL